MKTGVRTKRLRIGGMTCVNCQNKIEKKLRNTAGIERAEVSYNTGTAVVTYDTDIISLRDIVTIIQKLDYAVLRNDRPEPGKNRTIGLLMIGVALYVLLQQFGLTRLFTAFPLAQAGMGYGMLFVIGLVTSVHCVAMCGGINLSQCIPQAAGGNDKKPAALRPSLLYNLGRVISYTVVGGIVGALGSVLSFSGGLKGIVQLVAGGFMVIMGLNMLGVFPGLRRFNLSMPKVFARKVEAKKSGSKSPLYVGLLNGLMPCGPLQAMQLYALSAGSPAKGALSMLLFSLGTVPLMFALGALSSVLTKKFTHKLMTVGALLVMVLGLSMFAQGWSLSGLSLPGPLLSGAGGAPGAGSKVNMANGVQVINSTLASGGYPAITVQVGIPVKWTIDAPKGSINGCNNRIVIPEYNIQYQFKTGQNTIEFTPTKTGKFPYSCWMGMIRSSITVVEAGADTSDTATAANSAATADSGFTAEPSEPVPAGVVIPATDVMVGKINANHQQVKIKMTDKGFSPAVVVLQANVETEWIIDNHSSRAGNSSLLFPAYRTQVPMAAGETPLYLYPTASFDFSTKDNAFYGYVKVVDDINNIDLAAIKKEAAGYPTQIWPPEYFENNSSNNGSASN
jgi:sulfite exporter TauE/SafE/copper chaperone CopZ